MYLLMKLIEFIVTEIKNNRSTNASDSDSFYIIFNQDGSVYKNLGYTDNPSANYLTSYGGCLTKNNSILFGAKWSTTYQTGKPQLFIFDKLGNLQKSLWANTSSSVSHFFDGFQLPNTDQVVLNDDETYNSSGNPRFVNYDITSNAIKWNFSFNSFARRNTVGSICSRILFDSDNNIYFIGYLKSNKNLIHIIKMNQSRQILWSKSYYKEGITTACNAILGGKIFDNIIYIGCYCVDNSVKYIIKIDCELGDITKQWKNINNASYGLNYLTSYNNSLYSIARSTDNTLLLSKLSFSDLDYYSNIELKDYYNLIEGHEYISSDITSTITNYSDISFSNASYLTSTQLNVSNITLNSREKLEAIYS